MPLADVQRAMRDAVVCGDVSGASAFVESGWASRLAIHQRNFEASLVKAIMSRFPATEWLIGSRPLYEAAIAFVHEQPPVSPCIAEYGAAFPTLLASRVEGHHLPYLRDFAEIDWQLGRVSVAIDPELGCAYVRSDWPIDLLIAKFLDPSAPDPAFGPEPVWLEIRGCRGAFTFLRLTPGEFEVRHRTAQEIQ